MKNQGSKLKSWKEQRYRTYHCSESFSKLEPFSFIKINLVYEQRPKLFHNFDTVTYTNCLTRA